MWPPGSVTIAITEVGNADTALVEIGTPAGQIRILCRVEWRGRTLYMREAHIEGLSRGRLGRGGLNAIGAEILAEADVDAVVVEGAERTTGTGPHRGRRPPPFRYPR